MDAPSTDQGQPTSAESPESRHGGGSLFLWLFIALVTYVLSIGPVTKLSDYSVLPRAAVDSIYTPIHFLCYHFAPARYFYNWYIYKLWACLRIID